MPRVASTAGTTTAATKAAAAWNGLNTRQRAYLLCLYRLDQEAEATEREAFAEGGRARPATQWRWITYGYVNVGRGAPRGAMQRALDVRDRRDQGAGSTLAVLTERRLIEHRRDELPAAALQAPWCREDTHHVSVKLTRAGRAAARVSGVDDTRPRRAPRGLLSEWLWTVLVQVWRAGDGGVPDHRRYTAWHYLTGHKSGALVEPRSGSGVVYVLTDLGR